MNIKDLTDVLYEQRFVRGSLTGRYDAKRLATACAAALPNEVLRASEAFLLGNNKGVALISDGYLISYTRRGVSMVQLSKVRGFQKGLLGGFTVFTDDKPVRFPATPRVARYNKRLFTILNRALGTPRG